MRSSARWSPRVGSLAAGAPALIGAWTGWPTAYVRCKPCSSLYALLGVAVALAYRGLAARARFGRQAASRRSARSRRAVFTLAALFSLDAFGGGFIVQSLIALWLYQRFDLSLAAAGHDLLRHRRLERALVPRRRARSRKRIGLVNTMVFTHLPANLCLVAIPFVPISAIVIALLCVRSLLSQMDVPTRSSYVMAIVTPEERPAAASITAVPRSLASAASPFMAGYLLTLSTFGWPLVAAGGHQDRLRPAAARDVPARAAAGGDAPTLG